MDNSVITAFVGAGSSALIAVTARLLNYRGFVSIDSRFASIERRLDMMQADMKDLNKTMAALRSMSPFCKDKANLWPTCLRKHL